MPILQASQLSCEKQHRTLFQDIDLTVNSGELVLLKGENGAGKTSLLRILVGLSKPNSGQVLVNGHCISSDINLAAARLIYIGHKLGLNGALNPIESLQFYITSLGISTPEVAKIESILSALSLDGTEDLPVKNLSAGQQRRVGLAKLWLNTHANFWVLDEPFTALDTQTIDLLEKHISAFLQAGGCVLMTSHQTTTIQDSVRIFELEYEW